MKNILFLLVFLLISTSSLYAQKLAKLKKANEAYLNKQYTTAVSEYEALMTTESGRNIMGLDSRINLAECYRMTNENVKAEQLFRELPPDAAKSRPELLINYGEVLIGVGKYDEAKTQFEAYSKIRPEDARSAELIKKCADIQAIRPLYFEVKITAQEVVNDSLTEQFGLAYYGRGLVFASNQILSGNKIAEWKGLSGVDILYSEIAENGDLLAPRLLSKKLNAINRQDGPATFTRDGKTIIYSQSVKPSVNAPEGTICLQLFTAKNENGKWSKPEIMPFNIPDMIFSHPSLSADGTQLFFVSNMSNGSMGGLDIWVSSFKNGKWTTPRNAGEAVNTKADESFPFIHHNGDLYFASRGHGNYGGFDLFKAAPVGNGIDWERAVNIGSPVNSAFDDTYFLLADQQNHGFLVSNRNGTDDVFRFELSGLEAKELPSNIQARSAAIFNDSTDLEGFIVENPTDTKKENPNDTEKFVDDLIANGGKKTDSTDNSNPKNPSKTDKNTENPKPENTDVVENSNPENPNADKKTNKKTDKNPKKDNSDPKNTDNPEPENTDVVENTEPKNPSDTKNSKKTDKTDKSKKDKENADLFKEKAELLVEIQVVDAKDKNLLATSTLILRNAFTGKEEKLKIEGGKAILELKTDQKYEVVAACVGYHGGRLPITTMGAYKTEKLAATFPLVKKD